jgi:hypothetical protein
MRKIILYILEIIVISFLTAAVIQYFSDKGLRNLKNSIYNDWQNIIEGKINSDILIMGSSRGFVCYNSKVIEDKLKLKTFNISYNAAGYKLQQSKFDIYLKNNIKPKIIIQNIDLAHFNENRVLPEEFQFIPFLNNEYINDLVIPYDRKYNCFRYIPLLKYNQNLNLLKNGIYANFWDFNVEYETTYAGYSPQQRIFKVDSHNLKKLKKMSEDGLDINEYRRIFLRIVEFYNARFDGSTKIIFVWAPEHSLRLNKIYDLARNPLINELESIQRDNKNIYFINMSHDEISNHDNYFYDTFHLNKRGSQIFSKNLSIKIHEILK